MKRYSKKRQAILDLLRHTEDHPSADSVYQQLKPSYPDLSLGTVYRNLNEMKADGSIMSVAVVKDRERFDGQTEPHTHAICSGCGRITDLNGITLPPELLKRAEEVSGYSFAYPALQFVGLCSECVKARDKT